MVGHTCTWTFSRSHCCRCLWCVFRSHPTEWFLRIFSYCATSFRMTILLCLMSEHSINETENKWNIYKRFDALFDLIPFGPNRSSLTACFSMLFVFHLKLNKKLLSVLVLFKQVYSRNPTNNTFVYKLFDLNWSARFSKPYKCEFSPILCRYFRKIILPKITDRVHHNYLPITSNISRNTNTHTHTLVPNTL